MRAASRATQAPKVPLPERSVPLLQQHDPLADGEEDELVLAIGGHVQPGKLAVGELGLAG